MGQHEQGPRDRARRGVWVRNLQTVCQCQGTKYKIRSSENVSEKLGRGQVTESFISHSTLGLGVMESH